MFTVFLSVHRVAIFFQGHLLVILGDSASNGSIVSLVISDLILFYQYWGFKHVLMLRKLLYFDSNNKSILLLSPCEYRSTQIYVHQKRPFSGYKPWAYIWDFTVLDYNDTLDVVWNGFTRWRTRKHLLVPRTCSVLQLHFILLFLNYIGEVQCESPNNRLDKFQGNLNWKGHTYSLDNNNIILRVSSMKI